MLLHKFLKPTLIPIRTHVGYLPFEGRIPNNKTPAALFKSQLKAINLKPVKRIAFKVDPIHARSASIRQLMTLMSHEKVKRTGLKTVFKYDFVSDRSEPTVSITFHDNDHELLFKTAYLSEFDIIYEMNKVVLPLVKEEVVNVSKKAGGSAGKKKK